MPLPRPALALCCVLVLAPAAATAASPAAAADPPAAQAPHVVFGEETAPRHPPEQQPLELRELAWRSIGPANCGGRIADFAVVEKHPATFYVATATGGLFKTTNRGQTWSGVFDRQPVASIGAVAVWQKHPDVVWVGTGEANNRNSSSWGDGVYRSSDGGESWTHVGLEATREIARVVIDPEDSATVYVAAMGKLWGENPERGVFRTTDNGRTWSHVLELDDRTGAIDLVMDPSDRHTLYAATYARRRTAWSYTGGGPTGGIWRTRDGGRTWRKLAGGLPGAPGRIGLDVWRKDPRVVFAVIESDSGGRVGTFEDRSRTGGVFRSDDRGDHWRRLSDVIPRPFYFSQIRVQPDDTSRVYVLGVDLWLSDDGGHTFRGGGAANLHPDCHAMWVDPLDGAHVLMGTDGGVYVSEDKAAHWDFLDNLAIGEFYDIALDDRDPYWVCGGLQDNQSWCGPSRTHAEPDPFLGENEHNGITNDQWFCLGGGDGFHVAIDPQHPELVYYESQGGEINRQNTVTGKERNLHPVAKEGEPAYRFNWNTPFQISPHDPSVLWVGGNHLFRLTQRGDHWALASPDLTTQNPARMVTAGSRAETYCTIVALAESPRAAGQVWVGTDDGKVWVTHDSGGRWQDVSANLRGIPAGLYVACVEPSHHDPSTVYVAVDGHRSDDVRPYLLVSHDSGRSFHLLSAGLPRDWPVLVVREDPVNPRLLFAGTENGVFVSMDAGASWQRFDHGLPTVAVDDIQIQPREHDLVIATHGRSVWVMDDISPLEHWSPEVTRRPIAFFPPRPASAFLIRSLSGFWGQRFFSAKNPPFGAWFNYYVKANAGHGVKIVVRDAAGHTVRELSGPGTPGLHRVVWDLQAGDPRQRIGRSEWNDQPQFVSPGRYTVALTYGDGPALEQPLVVRVPEELADTERP